MPEDESKLYCMENGCKYLDGEAYRAVNQLRAAQRIDQYLVSQFAVSAQDVARLSELGRRLVEDKLGLDKRSDSTWALAIALLNSDN